MHDTFLRSLAASAAILAFAALPARAEITEAECEKLRQENQALVAQGVPKLMEKGPEWAKANLPADKLALVKRLLDVSEQIMFRCEKLRPINTKVEQVDSEGADTEEGEAKPGAGTPSASPPSAESQPTDQKPQPKPKRPAPVRQKSAAKPEGEEPGPTSTPPPKASSAAKPKPNDAFVPPAGSGSTLDQQTQKP